MKDLSRIGREFLYTSYYIEEYFPSKKVRFVSVNDHFDTIDGINSQEKETSSRIRILITNAFNEQVSLDIRKKTKYALDIKQHAEWLLDRERRLAIEGPMMTASDWKLIRKLLRM